MGREDNIAWWSRVRRIGFWRFVLLYGVVGFGGCGFLAWTLGYLSGVVVSRDSVLGILPWFVLGGWICGGLVWLANEFLYRRGVR